MFSKSNKCNVVSTKVRLLIIFLATVFCGTTIYFFFLEKLFLEFKTDGRTIATLWSRSKIESKINELIVKDIFYPVPSKRKKDSKGRSYILMWRYPWGISTESWADGTAFDDCVVTNDRSKLPDAEAVIFHYTAITKALRFWPHYRDREQIFVYFSVESPSYIYEREQEHAVAFNYFDGFFNVTMGYRTDFDIFYPYETQTSLWHLLKNGTARVDELMLKKKRVALWLVSNCDMMYGSIKRMEYSNELVKAGLPIDRYGKCFKNSFEYTKLDEEILDSYKFYLAFENALHCKDYITEKFWTKGISAGRVPVVWGPSKENVVRLAPTNSFIHTEDFESPASLASYLLYLDKNDTAYREYFKWREKPDKKTIMLAQMRKRTNLFKLCDRIKEKKRRSTIVPSVSGIYKNDSQDCFRAKES